MNIPLGVSLFTIFYKDSKEHSKENKMNLEDRRDSIVKVFARYLYAHLYVPLSFDASRGGWDDWANLVRRFAESLQHPKNRQKYDMQHEIERLQDEMVDFSKTVHISRFFPVVPRYKEKLYYRIKDLCDELSWTMSTKLFKFLYTDHVEQKNVITSNIKEQITMSEDAQLKNVESEYLFKTYEILSGNIFSQTITNM